MCVAASAAATAAESSRRRRGLTIVVAMSPSPCLRLRGPDRLALRLRLLLSCPLSRGAPQPLRTRAARGHVSIAAWRLTSEGGVVSCCCCCCCCCCRRLPLSAARQCRDARKAAACAPGGVGSSLGAAW
jgi:hypothetical protein